MPLSYTLGTSPCSTPDDEDEDEHIPILPAPEHLLTLPDPVKGAGPDIDELSDVFPCVPPDPVSYPLPLPLSHSKPSTCTCIHVHVYMYTCTCVHVYMYMCTCIHVPLSSLSLSLSLSLSCLSRFI